MIKQGYRRSNKNDASHQILRTYARFDSFKIDEMNIQADLPRPIADELRAKQRKQEIGLVTWQPQGFTLTIKTISQFNHTLKDLPDLVHDYHRRKLSTGSPIELDTVKKFPIEIYRLLRIPVEICQMLRVPVENFQDV